MACFAFMRHSAVTGVVIADTAAPPKSSPCGLGRYSALTQLQKGSQIGGGGGGLPEGAENGCASEAKFLQLRKMLGTDTTQGVYLFVDDTLICRPFQVSAGESCAVTLFRDAVVDGTEEQIVAAVLIFLYLGDAVAGAGNGDLPVI